MSISAVLSREVLPDRGGLLSFAILLTAVGAQLFLGPDPQGCFFGSLEALLPYGLRGPMAGAVLESLGQSFLLLAPPVATYAAFRRLRESAESLLPCLTLAAGGFITLLLGCGLLVQALGS